MSCDVELQPTFFGHDLSGQVCAVDHGSSDLQACRSRCGSDVIEDGVVGIQRLTRPVPADVAEEPMFDRVPLGRSGGIMADRHGEPKRIAQFLDDLIFPCPAAIVA